MVVVAFVGGGTGVAKIIPVGGVVRGVGIGGILDVVLGDNEDKGAEGGGDGEESEEREKIGGGKIPPPARHRGARGMEAGE